MRKAVLSFRDVFPDDTLYSFARALAGRYGIKLGDHSAPVDPPVVAWVNASAQVGYREFSGRWFASCECGGGEAVDVDLPVFMCCSCFNEAHGRQWRNVTLPDNRLWIEEALADREGKFRFWNAGETPEQLKSENEKLKKRLSGLGPSNPAAHGKPRCSAGRSPS